MNLLGYLFPSHALKRAQAQLQLQMIEEHKRKYEGASRGKRLGTWGLGQNSVNNEIAASLGDLRSRSHELCRNNPYANNAPKRIANNVAGTGILLTATRIKKNKKQEAAFKAAWNAWADGTSCDFNGLLNFYGLQNLVMRSLVKNGEAIVRKINTVYKKGEIPLELQIIDPAQINTSESRSDIADGGCIVNGIEFNASGKRVAYYIYDRNPLEYKAKSVRVPANEICHIFDIDDPGQVRGVPFFAPVILRMNDFDQYEDAQLIKQKVSASHALFKKKAVSATPTIGAETDDGGNVVDRVVPGMIVDLLPGEEIQVAEAPSVEGFGEYSRQSLQGQAVGLGMDYSSFTGDLSNVNFSSGKMGWIQSGLNYDHLQYNIMIPMFLDKVFGWFKVAALLARVIEDTEFKAAWTPPRRTMIDAGKEVKAIVEQVRGGFMSWREAVKQLGYIPEELLEEMASDQKQFVDGGLVPTSNPLFDTERIKKGEQPK